MASNRDPVRQSKAQSRCKLPIRKSGKANFIGFSTHHKDRAAIIQAAAEAGIVDAIMLQYTPWLDKDEPLNKALDTCYKKGIGLISMKQVAGQFPAHAKKNILEEVVKRAPMLAEKKLSPYQGLLHAIWTDERISGSCVSIKTTDQLREDADAARRYRYRGEEITWETFVRRYIAYFG